MKLEALFDMGGKIIASCFKRRSYLVVNSSRSAPRSEQEQLTLPDDIQNPQQAAAALRLTCSQLSSGEGCCPGCPINHLANLDKDGVKRFFNRFD